MGCLAAASLAVAHLSTSKLEPEALTMLFVGKSTTIKWMVVAAHNQGTAIAVSRDDGATWTDIKTGYSESPGLVNSFNWTVTGPASEKVKIRICQGSDTPAPCTNADTANSLTAAPNGHYVLIADSLRIVETTALSSQTRLEGVSIGFNPQSRNVDLTFGLVQPQDVALQVIDLQGRVMATLLQGRYAAGAHSLSVFSNQFDPSAKALVFKLTLGNQVHTQVWSGL